MGTVSTEKGSKGRSGRGRVRGDSKMETRGSDKESRRDTDANINELAVGDP